MKLDLDFMGIWKKAGTVKNLNMPVTCYEYLKSVITQETCFGNSLFLATEAAELFFVF